MDNLDEVELKNVLEELKEAVVDLKENIVKLEQMKEQSLILKEKALKQLELCPEDSRQLEARLKIVDKSIFDIDFMIDDTEKYISYLTDKISGLTVI